jgi:beta-fructofuranosidase
MLTLNYAGKPSSSDSIIIGEKSIPLNPDSERVSNIHLWVDGSIIEIFIDSKQVLTMRSYLDNAESAGLKVLWSGAAEALVNLTVSTIIPISGNRLTT